MLARYWEAVVVVEVAVTVDLNASSRPGTGSMGRATTHHCHTRAEFGAAQRNHVLPDPLLDSSLWDGCSHGKGYAYRICVATSSHWCGPLFKRIH